MCTCKFCATSFYPRPQTKNPQACNNPQCQKARQRKNERDWHLRHKNLYAHSPKYHQGQRKIRYALINKILMELFDAICSGIRFKGLSIDLAVFEDFFSIFLHRTGIRKINKFYQPSGFPVDKAMDIKP